MRELRSITPHLLRYRSTYLWGLGLVAVSNLFTVAVPWILKLGIDALGAPGTTPTLLAGYAGLLVLAALLGGAAKFGMREVLNGVSRRVESDLRMDFFRHLVRLDASFHRANRTGEIMSLATHDTLAIRMAVGPAIMYLVNTIVIFAFCVVLMLGISLPLTGLALLPLLALPPVAATFGALIQRRFTRIQEQYSLISTMAQENLTGVRIVRAFGQEEDQTRRFAELNREYLERNMAMARISGVFHPTLALLTGSGMILLLWFGGGQVMDGRISTGEFVAFGFYLGLLGWPMVSLGWVVNLLQRGDASMARLNRVLRTEPAIQAPPEPHPLPRIRGDVEFVNVTFCHPGSERRILDGISFRAAAGETVAIVGPTGSGKSTLVSLIPRLIDATKGEVRVDGIPVTRLDPQELRRGIGVVPQDPFLFSDTLGANLALGVDGEPSDAVRQAAETAQLNRAIEGLPLGFETPVGERGTLLSGGQKQRATLARALARAPGILILDDALSAVDTQTEGEILRGLRTALEGRTTFIISHRL